MATTRLIPLHSGKGRNTGTAIARIIDYVANPEKTRYGELITSWQCDSRVADAQFLLSKQQYIQQTGRVQGKENVIAYHLRQSFRPGEITPEEANRLGCELARRFTKENHAFIVCTHVDKAHIHNHIIWNSTSLDANRKFRNFWGSTEAIRRLSDTICIQNGYSIVENPARKGKSYDKWLGDKKKPSHRERICAAIDDALAQKPATFEALLDLLRQAGYLVKDGAVPSLLGEGQKRFLRMDTLGENYSPDVLRAVIQGQRKHTPRKREKLATQKEETPGNLILDMQKILQQKKGAAYENWAKRFNLKQAAQTLLFLQEHNLTQYFDLQTRAAAVSAEFHEVRKNIKELEEHLQRNAILQRHIQNYSKTRQIYVEYQKSHYDPKFKEAHEQEILLHMAARKYFDELGTSKFPTIKSLKAEYADLLAQKKAAYAVYRKKKAERDQLQTALANVEAMLPKRASEKEIPPSR